LDRAVTDGAAFVISLPQVGHTPDAPSGA
jgi:hypothetical protein